MVISSLMASICANSAAFGAYGDMLHVFASNTVRPVHGGRFGGILSRPDLSTRGFGETVPWPRFGAGCGGLVFGAYLETAPQSSGGLRAVPLRLCLNYAVPGEA